MVNVEVRPQEVRRARQYAKAAQSMPSVRRTSLETMDQPCLPTIEVSESDGTFMVHADFRMVPDADNVSVEFAQQGIIVSGGTAQRYIPIPTDGDIESAKVNVTDGIARISIRTAGLGHRWRAIVMW
jgi:hypothetical protein